MLTIYPAAERFSFDRGWLRGSHSFAFGEYQDESNMAFGPMRVCNDDFIAPGRGFGAHPHSDMEIISIVLSGALRHEDSMGNVAVSTYGGIQRMSAGSGVIHTEHNASDEEEVNLLQLWFTPHTRGLKPSYEAITYDTDLLAGQLLPVVTPQGGEGQAFIHQDMTVYLSRLQSGETLHFTQTAERKVFLFVIEGSLMVHGQELNTRDTARIEAEEQLGLTAGQPVFFMLVDLPE
ncbi:pirin family protein [Paenibacillus sp. JX-17]|uniref:Pirin family protein n=1 Tax=Paenibacillus lacisoli TaxID=3064525 RepID=A0ABT9CAZ7_9BACL|nr:pirin family protein [Paenibacillus sp. JX-17]MDO7906441.1 pirin family protein [Paenibacillus sp. JX-17]